MISFPVPMGIRKKEIIGSEICNLVGLISSSTKELSRNNFRVRRFVNPAQAGIQSSHRFLGSRRRGNDDKFSTVVP